MESDLPNFDLPSDYMVGEGYGINLLKRYKNFPCRVKAGFFILCVKGIMQTTINGNLQNIGENDLITLPPGYFMEILDFSPDIHIMPLLCHNHFRSTALLLFLHHLKSAVHTTLFSLLTWNNLV